MKRKSNYYEVTFRIGFAAIKAKSEIDAVSRASKIFGDSDFLIDELFANGTAKVMDKKQLKYYDKF